MREEGRGKREEGRAKSSIGYFSISNIPIPICIIPIVVVVAIVVDSPAFRLFPLSSSLLAVRSRLLPGFTFIPGETALGARLLEASDPR
jgi:hypothetical protein